MGTPTVGTSGSAELFWHEISRGCSRMKLQNEDKLKGHKRENVKPQPLPHCSDHSVKWTNND